MIGKLVPPELTTPSGLLDRFLVRKQAYADELTSQLAWLEALNRASASTLKAVTGHDTPPTKREATALAKRFAWRAQGTRGAGGTRQEKHCNSDWMQGLPIDVPRWSGLEHLWQDVQSILASSNRIDADVARRDAIESDAIQIDGIEMVSIVSADPTRLMGHLLRALDSRNLAVHSIIHGDAEDLADDFDELGAIDVDTWVNRPIDLSGSTVVCCERVDDQAAVILEHLADRSEQFGSLKAEQVTVVIPDDASVGILVRETANVVVFPAPMAISRCAGDGRICRLLQVLGDLLEEEASRHFGDLVRHPDVEQWLIAQGVMKPGRNLGRLVEPTFSTNLGGATGRIQTSTENSKGLLGDLLDLIDPLHGAPRPATEWARPLMHVLGNDRECIGCSTRRP